MPQVVGSAAVFQDQNGDCGAFHLKNLQRQIDAAAQNSEPPWAVKKTRRKTERKSPRQPEIALEPVEWSEEEAAELVQAYGVSLSEPLRFKINLCEDGSVITKDGEIIGTWTMDENAHPSFFPDGTTEPLIFVQMVQLDLSLCARRKSTKFGKIDTKTTWNATEIRLTIGEHSSICCPFSTAARI